MVGKDLDRALNRLLSGVDAKRDLLTLRDITGVDLGAPQIAVDQNTFSDFAFFSSLSAWSRRHWRSAIVKAE